MATAAASAAVVAAQSAAVAHIATLAVRWQQRRGCDGVAGTVRECAEARAFERHGRADVRIFVIGREQRDDSADGIVIVSSNGGARGESTAVVNALPPPPTMPPMTTPLTPMATATPTTLFVKLNLI